jgi:hypothetical protein
MGVIRAILAIAILSASALAILMLPGCDNPGSLVLNSKGDLVVFQCDKTDRTYTAFNLSTGTSTSGTFDTATQNCVDVENDIFNGVDPQTKSPFNPVRAPGAKSATPQSKLQYMLDVGNYYAVQILDTTTLKFTEVDLPNDNGRVAYPVSMAITPDGKSIWVLQTSFPANSAGIPTQPARITIMDTASQTFTGSFNLPDNTGVHTIRFSPDGATAFISNDGTVFEGVSGNATASTVMLVDVATRTLRKTISTPKGAGYEAVSPDGLQLYTIFDNLGGASALTVIDLTTETVGASVALPNGSLKMYINPNGTRLYIFTYRGITVIDTATLQDIADISTVGFSIRNNFMDFSASGQTAWLCNCGFGIYYNIDLRTNKIIQTLQAADLGHGFMYLQQQ